MTTKDRRALLTIAKRVKRNRPLVIRRFAKAGVRLRPAVAFTAAQYLTTLDKLAKE